MKKSVIFTVIVVFLVSADSCSKSSGKMLRTDVDTMSYYFGLGRADGVKSYLVNQAGVDTAYMDEFFKGFKDGMKHYSPKDVAYTEGKRIALMINNQWIPNLNEDVFLGDSNVTVNRKAIFSGFYYGVKNPQESQQMQAESFGRVMMEKIKEEYRQKKYADIIAENTKFLFDNKKKEGVKITETGLQYKIITEGKGDIPERGSKVKVNYRGTLIDGTEFDSSYKNNSPSDFRVNQVIKGWIEALTMMPVGSKWMLYIPQELAYGAAGQGNIPPYSTLIYELELIEIDK